MGGGVSGEVPSVQYLCAELFETDPKWTPAWVDSGSRFFDNNWEVAAVGYFLSC